MCLNAPVTSGVLTSCLSDVQAKALISLALGSIPAVPTYTLTDIGVLPGFTEIEGVGAFEVLSWRLANRQAGINDQNRHIKKQSI
jgi:hypothetical protein